MSSRVAPGLLAPDRRPHAGSFGPFGFCAVVLFVAGCSIRTPDGAAGATGGAEQAGSEEAHVGGDGGGAELVAANEPVVSPDGGVGQTPAGARTRVEPLPACGVDSASNVAACVDRARYVADLEVVAQPRPPGSQHWKVVQDLCASRLESLGFDVERHRFRVAEGDVEGVNVIGRRGEVREGGPAPVLIGAHYDHIEGCQGADDNATGVAGVLELARVLAAVKPDTPLLVACWDQEEAGLLGSRAFVADGHGAALAGGTHLNVEMIGVRKREPGSQELPPGLGLLFPEAQAELEANGRRGDFIAAVADESSAETLGWLEAYAGRVGLPIAALALPELVKDQRLAPDLHRSDHASFWDVDLPGLMVADTADLRYPSYHCRDGNQDELANLDHEFSVLVLQALAATAARRLGLDGEDGVTRP